MILVTGWSTPLKAEELVEAGVAEVVYKPFRIEQLTAVVRNVVAGRVQVLGLRKLLNTADAPADNTG